MNLNPTNKHQHKLSRKKKLNIKALIASIQTETSTTQIKATNIFVPVVYSEHEIKCARKVLEKLLLQTSKINSIREIRQEINE